MTTQEKNGITEGVIWKQLLIFFFPILVGSFFSSYIIRWILSLWDSLSEKKHCRVSAALPGRS